jgi:uncharacterized membrane protein YhaH (DUF805 family)
MKKLLKECFNTKIRWNRKRYWSYLLVILSPIFVITFTVNVLISLWLIPKFIIENLFIQTIIGMIVSWIYLVVVWILILWSIKRLHDLNKSWWWAILVFIPFIQIIPTIYLSFFKWTQGENRFGPDPLGGTNKKSDNWISNKL